jgi:hypothetical protein
MRSLLFSVLLFVFFCVSTDVSASQKWVRVELLESSLNLKNYSHSDDCVLSKKYTSQYAYELTVANCPQWPSNSEPRTYIRLAELQVGYFWGIGWHTDIRQTGIFRDFNGKSQWIKFFNKAEFDEGQKFNCLANHECAFRRLTFTVRTPEKNHRCQWVGFVPDLRAAERSDAPFKVEIATCETATPITEQHISVAPGKVTIKFPAEKKQPGATRVVQTKKPTNTETSRKASPPSAPKSAPKTNFGKSFAPKSLPPKSSNKADLVSQKPISNIQKRLEILKKLEKNGLISSEEARKKREAILGEL